MKKQILLTILLLINLSIVTAQVGVRTINPQGKLHIDAKSNNPETGTPSIAQQSDDFIVTEQGYVGIGTITPGTTLEINSATNGVTGLKFGNLNSSSPININSAKLGVDATGNLVVHETRYNIGDIKNSTVSIDHDGWYVLNGRAVSSLSAAAQSAAISLGFNSNLPDATDRTMKVKNSGEAMGSKGGTNTLYLSLSNMPSINLGVTISGTTNTVGNHNHSAPVGSGFLLGNTTVNNPGNAWNYRGNVPYPGAWGGTGWYPSTAYAGDHTHAVYGTATFNSGGQNNPIDNRQPFMVTSPFIYLGQ